MRTLALVIPLALLAGAAGCADDKTPAYLPAESPTAAEVVPLDTTSPGPTPTASPSITEVPGLDGQMKPLGDAATIPPDEELMASMRCEPLGEQVDARIYNLWGYRPVSSTRVEVGEGLTPGEVWWVFAFSYERDGHVFDHAMLTSNPSYPGEGSWLILGDEVASESNLSSWDGVKWDAERLERGQSALAKALSCLKD